MKEVPETEGRVIEGRVADVHPAGERLGRVICISGGRVLAWIMKVDEDLIYVAQPPHRADRVGRLAIRLLLKGSSADSVTLPCRVCGKHELQEGTILRKVAEGRREGRREVEIRVP